MLFYAKHQQITATIVISDAERPAGIGTSSMQQSAQQRGNNSTLMGWMFWMSLGAVVG
jgi:hypothetical protein